MEFPNLANYASFLLKDNLDELVTISLERAREVDLPLLKSLANYSDNQLYMFSKERFQLFLEGIVEGRAKKEAEENNRRWEMDEMPGGIRRRDINIEDIALTAHVRKHAMLCLLERYTTDMKIYRAISLEIEEIFTFIINLSLQQYARLQEKLLLKEENLINLLVNNIPDGISGFDKEKNITIWNNALERRTGITKSQILGKQIQSLFPQYVLTFTEELLSNVLSGQSIILRNQPYLHREGFYDIELFPLKNDKEEVIGGISISRDISEAKVKEEQIRKKNEYLELLNTQLQNEKRFSKALLKSEVNGIVAFDKQLNFTEWNVVMERIFGKKASEVLGKNIFKLFPGIDTTDLAQSLRAALEGKTTILLGKKGFAADFYYNAYIMPLEDDEGRIYGVVTMVLDVSEQKESEAKLKEREHFLEKITDVTPAVITIYNVIKGEYKFVNKAVETLIGYSREEVLRDGYRFLASIVHPDDLTKVEAENKKSVEDFREGHSFPYEYRVKHKNGNWRWIKTYRTVFSKEEDGRIRSVLNVSVDITERKFAEKELGSKNEIIEGILQNLPVVATRVDRKGNITESIGSGLYDLGMAQNEAVGINIVDGFPHNATFTSQVLEGKRTNFTSVIDHPLGRKYHQNYFFPDQSNEGFIGFSLDITAQKEAEERLSETQKFIEKVAEIAPYPIAVMDYKTKHLLYVNSESLRILGYSDEEIKDRKAEDLISTAVHPDDIYKISSNHEILGRLADDEVHALEYRLSDRNGNWIWLSSKMKVFKRDAEGKVDQYITVAADITQRKQHELEIAEKNKELEALLEELRSAEDQLITTNNDLERRVLERTSELAASEEELKQTLDKTIELNEKIQERENFLSSIIEQTPISTWIADSTGTQIQVNQACLDLFGVPDASYGIGKYNVLKDESIQNTPLYADLVKVFREGKVAKYTSHYNIKDVTHIGVEVDKPVYLNITAFPIRNAEGQVTHAVFQHEDITEKKKAEEALLKSEERLRLITNSLPVLIAYVDSKETYRFVNDQYLTWFLLTREDIVNKTIKDLLGESYYKTAPMVHRALKGELVKYEAVIEFKGKGARNVEINYVPDVEKGQVKGFYSLVYDVTESKKNQHSLQTALGELSRLNSEKEELLMREQDALASVELERNVLYNLFMQTPALLAINRGKELIFELANPKYMQLINTSESVEGKSLDQVIPGVSQEVKSILNAVLETGKRFVGNELPISQDWERSGTPTTKYFTLIYEPILEQNGKVDRLITFGYEVTDHVKSREKLKEVNEEIKRKNVELVRINNDLDNFIYTASHDLKSPISNMEGLILTMEKTVKPKLEEKEKKMFQMMEASIERLKNTITSLTDISKLSKNLEEKAEAVSFKEIIEDVKHDLAQTFNDVPFAISEAIEVEEIHFVKPNLRSIVFNLLNNAIKYRSPERKVQIITKTHLDGKFIVLSVQDNGLGIKQEHKEKLFMLFRRLHKHVEGTGVGLYIVKKIVENAGGRIEVESALNEGTTFKVFLPLK